MNKRQEETRRERETHNNKGGGRDTEPQLREGRNEDPRPQPKRHTASDIFAFKENVRTYTRQLRYPLLDS